MVRINRASHLLCCRALEVQKYVYALDALHLRHPVNSYSSWLGVHQQLYPRERQQIIDIKISLYN